MQKPWDSSKSQSGMGAQSIGGQSISTSLPGPPEKLLPLILMGSCHTGVSAPSSVWGVMSAPLFV